MRQKAVSFLFILFLASCRLWADSSSGQADPLDYKLDPRHYDIFFNKCERIYLSGGDWKLKLLPKTEKNPANDPGTKGGFMTPSFDDNRWLNQVVPWNWNRPYPETWEGFERPKGKMRAFAGVGWYRKRFKLPASAEGKRLLLWFGSVEQDCIVYLNGKKVGTHEQYYRYYASSRGYDIESFELDVTPFARPGRLNVLAVRVFDDGSGSYFVKDRSLTNDVGGIWAPVVLRIESSIYARDIRVSPRIAESAIDVTCTLINTAGKKRTLNPVAEIVDYASDRYKPRREGTPIKALLKPLALKSGRNTFSFKLHLKDPIYWSHEEPHLYLLRLTAPEADGTGLLGLARFGFREMTVSGKRFLLNGKPVRLRGTDRPSLYSGRRDICANQMNVNGEYTRFLVKDLNFNWSRCHKWPGRALFDLCDEEGHMLNSSFFAFLPLFYGHWVHWLDGRLPEPPPAIDRKTLKINKVFRRRALEPWIAASYNHPSIVMYNVANEPYDSPDFKKGPALAAVRAAIKALDSTRLCASYSGRWPLRDAPTPTDFWDVHDYTGSACSRPYPALVKSLESFYKGYAGAEKIELPMVNGEAIWPSITIPWRMGSNMGVNYKNKERLSRKQYADAVNKLMEAFDKSRSGLIRDDLISLQHLPLDVALDWERVHKARAPQFKRMIEIHRWSDYCEGFNMHCQNVYRPFDDKALTMAAKLAIRNACRPLWIGAELFDANLFAGSGLVIKVRVVNDTLSPCKALLARLADPETRTRIKEEMQGSGREFDTDNITGGWDGVFIGLSAGHPEYQGKTVKQISEQLRKDPIDTVMDIIVECNCVAFVNLMTQSEDNVRLFIQHQEVMIGSDAAAMAPEGLLGMAMPHPRTYGTFPRVLGKYAREEKILGLPEAVRKMTSLPASRLGLKDRGVIARGNKADLVLFNADMIDDRATYEDPNQYPVGIKAVIVNGHVVVEDDEHTGALPGAVLKK